MPDQPTYGPGDPDPTPATLAILDPLQRQNVWSHLNELAGLAATLSNTTQKNAIRLRLKNWAGVILGSNATFDTSYVAAAEQDSPSNTGAWGVVSASPGAEEIADPSLRRRFWNQLQALYSHVWQSFTPAQRSVAQAALANVIHNWLPNATFQTSFA